MIVPTHRFDRLRDRISSVTCGRPAYSWICWACSWCYIAALFFPLWKSLQICESGVKRLWHTTPTHLSTFQNPACLLYSLHQHQRSVSEPFMLRCTLLPPAGHNRGFCHESPPFQVCDSMYLLAKDAPAHHGLYGPIADRLGGEGRTGCVNILAQMFLLSDIPHYCLVPASLSWLSSAPVWAVMYQGVCLVLAFLYYIPSPYQCLTKTVGLRDRMWNVVRQELWYFPFCGSKAWFFTASPYHQVVLPCVVNPYSLFAFRFIFSGVARDSCGGSVWSLVCIGLCFRGDVQYQLIIGTHLLKTFVFQ